MLHIKISAAILRPVFRVLDFFTPIADLLARVWVAGIFFMSGLTKLQDWSTTVLLFTHEYHVPLLPPVCAAFFGTAFELILPVLLVLGLGGRFFIFLFFVYNIVCMVSYHFLWTPEGHAGLADHISWGLLLMLLMCHGSGKLSLDYLIRKTWGEHLIPKPKKKPLLHS